MQKLRPEDVLHKSHLNRLLMEIIDQPLLAHNLAFKGGTCASMLGYLDRFSIDLDFDITTGIDENLLKQELTRIFDHLNLKIISKFDKILFFQLHYPAEPGKRNTLKLSAANPRIHSNLYQVQYFPEIDRLVNSQTIETMFANKLVAVTDRYRLHKTIAGRDIYDVHYFFTHGYSYHAPVIQERTGLNPKAYFEKLIAFINQHITQTVINEDLNSLLTPDQFQQIRRILIPETLSLLANERDK